MQELDDIRNEIDAIDEEIISLLTKRFAKVQEVSEFKKANNLQPEDLTRESKQYKRFKKLAEEYGIDGSLVKDVFEIIIEYAKKNHAIINAS